MRKVIEQVVGKHLDRQHGQERQERAGPHDTEHVAEAGAGGHLDILDDVAKHPTPFHDSLFQTGWFVESLFTQTLIIHVIRTNKIPFLQSRASWQLILTSLIIVAGGAWLTVSPLAGALGFVQLPPLYWLYLTLMLLGYAFLTQMVKTWFVRKFGE